MRIQIQWWQSLWFKCTTLTRCSVIKRIPQPLLDASGAVVRQAISCQAVGVQSSSIGAHAAALGQAFDDI